MTTDAPGSQLLGALLVLTAVAREFQRDARQPLPAAPLDALQGIVSRLTHRTVTRPLPCSEQYRQHWQGLRHNRRQQIDAHAIRHLCWDAAIATDVRFQTYLDRQGVILGPRALQGLVRSCHVQWSEELAEGAALRAVHRRVASYDGHHPLILRWKSALPMILGPQGPVELAKAMLHQRSPIKAWCELWAVDEQSPYVRASIRQAAQACREQTERSASSVPLIQYLVAELLPWSGWRAEDFQTELAATILHVQASTLWEPLTQLVLSDPRLGDPRLPGSEERWTGMPEGIRQRVIQWLSRAEIERRR